MVRSALAIGLLVACLALAGCGRYELPAADADGWITLFDGKTLDGWRSYARWKPFPAWTVEDGMITVVPYDEENDPLYERGALITRTQFSNFELMLEWRISHAGNSGVLYGVKEPLGEIYSFKSGIEVQILDDDHHPDNKVDSHLAGGIYEMYPAVPGVVRPVGEFNELRIHALNNTVTHWLNGVETMSYTIGSEDWNRRKAASKFADVEEYGQDSSGHIALQDHFNRVQFRNIRIKPL